MALTAPHEAAVVMTTKRAEAAMPKRDSLPSMLPPDCSSRQPLIDAELGQQRVAGLLDG